MAETGFSSTSMESRQTMILIVMTLLPILPAIFVTWRLYASMIVRKQYFRLADFLILLALISNVVALSCCARSAYYGYGKHMTDPTWTANTLILALKYLWIAEVLNLLAMLFVKLSIATFLLYLDLSTQFKMIIWATIGIVLACNGVVALLSLLGNCSPVALNWNRNLSGSCWSARVNAICAYIQSSANVLTDIIFAAAPIVYLSTVQLSRRNKWGLRIVFMFGLLAIICSIMKLLQLKVIDTTTDLTWDSADLTFWSSSEVNVAIFTACLPPLRTQFNSISRRFNFMNQSTHSRSCEGRITKTISIAMQNRSRASRTAGTQANDYGSERYILPPKDDFHGITKTHNIRVTDEENQT